jgi:hypothetical protein
MFRQTFNDDGRHRLSLPKLVEVFWVFVGKAVMALVAFSKTNSAFFFVMPADLSLRATPTQTLLTNDGDNNSTKANPLERATHVSLR